MKIPVARPHLSHRQRELIELAARGLADEEAARVLGLTVQTVRTYWKQIRAKFGGANRSRIVAEVLAADRLGGNEPVSARHVLYPSPVQVEAGEDFRSYERQMVSALFALNLPIVVVWGDEGTIIFGNRAFEELLMRPVAYSQSIRDYASWLGFWESGRQLAMHEWPVSRVLRGEAFVEEEIYFLRADGHWILARVQAVPILEDGKLAGAVAAALKLREFVEPPWSSAVRS